MSTKHLSVKYLIPGIKLNFKIAVKRNNLKDYYSSFHRIFYRNTFVEILVLFHFDTDLRFSVFMEIFVSLQFFYVRSTN